MQETLNLECCRGQDYEEADHLNVRLNTTNEIKSLAQKTEETVSNGNR